MNKGQWIIFLWLAIGTFSFAKLPESKIPGKNWGNEVIYEPQLDHVQFNANPMEQYLLWRKKVEEDSVRQSKAAILTTVKNDGWPASRVIGIKDVTKVGFVFFTNPDSNKAVHIRKNPKTAMAIVWHDVKTKTSYQVRIEGFTYPYSQPKIHNYAVKNQKKIIKWQAHILKPSYVQFSQVRLINGVGVVEYVDYVKAGEKWTKRKLPDYLAPGGC